MLKTRLKKPHLNKRSTHIKLLSNKITPTRSIRSISKHTTTKPSFINTLLYQHTPITTLCSHFSTKSSIYDYESPSKFDSTAAVWKPTSYTKSDQPTVPQAEVKKKRAILFESSSSKGNVDDVNLLLPHIRSSGSILCFTDGSALGNPGPSGSGISIEVPLHIDSISLLERTVPFLPKSSSNQINSIPNHLQEKLFNAKYSKSSSVPLLPHAIRYDYSFAVGGATNNYAELKALELILVSLENLQLTGEIHLSNRDVYVFSDSYWALAMMTGNYQPKTQYAQIVPLLRTKLFTIEQRYNININFAWCKGHAELAGNEIVDQLAVQGANFSLDNKIAADDSVHIHPTVSHSYPIYYSMTYSRDTINAVSGILKQGTEIPRNLTQKSKKDFFGISEAFFKETTKPISLSPLSVDIDPSLSHYISPKFPTSRQVQIVLQSHTPSLEAYLDTTCKNESNTHLILERPVQPLLTLSSRKTLLSNADQLVRFTTLLGSASLFRRGFKQFNTYFKSFPPNLSAFSTTSGGKIEINKDRDEEKLSVDLDKTDSTPGLDIYTDTRPVAEIDEDEEFIDKTLEEERKIKSKRSSVVVQRELEDLKALVAQRKGDKQPSVLIAHDTASQATNHETNQSILPFKTSENDRLHHLESQLSIMTQRVSLLESQIENLLQFVQKQQSLIETTSTTPAQKKRKSAKTTKTVSITEND